jgi:hypothetical protein
VTYSLFCTLYLKQEGKKHAEAKRLPLEEVDDNACADC